MKNYKKIRTLMLAALLLCVSLMLGACGEQPSQGETTVPTTVPSDTLDYQVTVVDALGTPYTTGVIVRILDNGEQVAMQVVDENGTVTKNLSRGEYTVELMFTGDENAYSYDTSDLTLTADKTSLEIVLSNNMVGEAVSLFADGAETQAYYVTAGGTNVPLTPGQRNYFLFAPTVAGTYEFSTADEVAGIGYYGAPHFVQSQSAAEVTDNTFTVSVSASMIGTGGSGTSVLVIGIDAGEQSECILTIQRIGEPEYNVADEPWTIYQTTAELAPYTLDAGAEIHEFDLTASTDAYALVYNEQDGFYHLDSADGPLVLVRLGVDGKYLDCFKTIVEHSGVVKYFYDENGEFDRKESYTECLMEYIEYMDETNGVYPLTEDLKYIIQQRGDYSGWWDPDGSLYLFVDENGNPVPDINTEIAWLFMCCYITAE